MVVHRFAHETDVPALLSLWQAAFPEDTPAQITAFLSSVELASECLVAEENGAVVSMVFMLPASLQADTLLPLQYIYAAATLPSHRGRGLFGDLLKQALKLAREQGIVASFLHPAQPSLCDYYARFGYRPFFYCETLCGEAKTADLAVRPVSGAEYARLRERWCLPFSVIWPARFLENTVAVGEGCAVCVPSGSVLYVRELFCDSEQQSESCEALAAHFGCTRYECRLPAERPTAAPFGLLCPLRPLNLGQSTIPYMGIALD